MRVYFTRSMTQDNIVRNLSFLLYKTYTVSSEFQHSLVLPLTPAPPPSTPNSPFPVRKRLATLITYDAFQNERLKTNI